MMTKEQALKHFNGNQAALARELGIERQAVWKWPDGEPIPELREKQLRYEILPKLKKQKSA